MVRAIGIETPESNGPSLPMPTAAVLIATAVIVFTTHYLGAVASFGATLLAIPLLLWVRDDLTLWIVLTLLIGTLQCVQVALYTWRDIDRRELGRILLWCGVALPVGLLSQRQLPELLLRAALGSVLIVSGLARLAADGSRGEQPLPRWLGRLTLLVAGVIHGAFTCGGSALVVYASRAIPAKRAFRATLTAVWLLLNTGLISARVAGGEIGIPHLWQAAALAPLVLTAGWLGQKSAERLPQAAFAKLVAGLLVLAGVVTIAKALR
jgi:uncharacterized membrane protein YfcA